jgi:hypothetical protein
MAKANFRHLNLPAACATESNGTARVQALTEDSNNLDPFIQ